MYLLARRENAGCWCTFCNQENNHEKHECELSKKLVTQMFPQIPAESVCVGKALKRESMVGRKISNKMSKVYLSIISKFEG